MSHLLFGRSDSATIHDFAPRLSLAVRQHRAHTAREASRRKRAQEGLWRAERLLAHRELQYARAMARGNRDYLRVREAKLAYARTLVERYRKAAA